MKNSSNCVHGHTEGQSFDELGILDNWDWTIMSGRVCDSYRTFYRGNSVELV